MIFRIKGLAGLDTIRETKSSCKFVLVIAGLTRNVAKTKKNSKI